MKINNETKVGALTALAITLLILGFNFLKGKSLFKTGNFVYAKVKQTKGLMVSNPVFINGLQIGAVYELEEANKNIDTIIIAIKLSKDVNIPNNSIASIKDNPLGSASMEISMGNSRDYIKNHDTIPTIDNPGVLGAMTTKLTPVVDQVKVTLQTLDSVLRNVNSVFDPYTKNNMQAVVGNFNRISASLLVSASSLQSLMNEQSGALSKSVGNLNSFTSNLAGNNDKISATMANLETSTRNLSTADINGTIGQLRLTVEKLNTAVAKIDSKEGSVGRLLNDNQLYDNLANTTKSLNTLMDDIRVNPKRYVSISIFGGKSKGQYLTSPLPVPDSTKAVTMK
ncbi:MAG TPA: MlaD family protein [Segetibacter sp.]|jgi:phospholipid/cholesterol/gamma-HCH transport system substrate-binding protein